MKARKKYYALKIRQKQEPNGTTYRSNKKYDVANKIARTLLRRYKSEHFLRKKLKFINFQLSSNHKLTDIQKSLAKFRNHCQLLLKYVCCVCCRLFFHKQVLVFDLNKYHKGVEEICSSNPTNGTNQKWICHTCNSYLRKRQIPPQAYENNLQLEDTPDELKDLNMLERHLICPILPFMKIVFLPKGKQKGIHGSVNKLCYRRHY